MREVLAMLAVLVAGCGRAPADSEPAEAEAAEGAPSRAAPAEVGIVPAEVEGAPAAEGPREADFAAHVRALEGRAPAGFTVVVSRPFVVIGDEPAGMVRRRAERTVGWATRHLKALYFEKDPAEILDVWLFKDDVSYRKHAKELFGDRPSTPFGYFSHAHGALVMNIGTGGGTLVHEMVHAFMGPNFPECPAWFNEGLASLYEQCGEEGGRICGRTNWRLAGLQEAIRDGRVPSFEKLTGTTSHEFYHLDKGTNYAQARYLCYWLQEEGLLVEYYRSFRAAAKEDPTGYATLGRVTGERDMAAFKTRWEQFVLGLRFP